MHDEEDSPVVHWETSDIVIFAIMLIPSLGALVVMTYCLIRALFVW
jgi:hypothetical protein